MYYKTILFVFVLIIGNINSGFCFKKGRDSIVVNSQFEKGSYKVSQLFDTSDLNHSWHVMSINNESDVLGSYQEMKCGTTIGKPKLFLFNKNNSLNFAPSDDYLYPKKLNNKGQVLGNRFVWDQEKGLTLITIPNSKSFSLNHINDHGQIIGSFTPSGSSCSSNILDRPFIWDRGLIKDLGLGSEFVGQIEMLGYHVMGLELHGINNNGELVGKFWYGKYHPKRHHYVHVGVNSFFWNGSIHLLPFDQLLLNSLCVNNNGTVLATTYSNETFLWSLANGLQHIPNFIGHKLCDSSIIFGYIIDSNNKNLEDRGITSGIPAIWNQCQITTIAELLGVDSLDHISPRYSEEYKIEAIAQILDMNSKGEILCWGILWGDRCPCLLEPELSSP